jgi:hypothetical protein
MRARASICPTRLKRGLALHQPRRTERSYETRCRRSRPSRSAGHEGRGDTHEHTKHGPSETSWTWRSTRSLPTFRRPLCNEAGSSVFQLSNPKRCPSSGRCCTCSCSLMASMEGLSEELIPPFPCIDCPRTRGQCLLASGESERCCINCVETGQDCSLLLGGEICIPEDHQDISVWKGKRDANESQENRLSGAGRLHRPKA